MGSGRSKVARRSVAVEGLLIQRSPLKPLKEFMWHLPQEFDFHLCRFIGLFFVCSRHQLTAFENKISLTFLFIY